MLVVPNAEMREVIGLWRVAGGWDDLVAAADVAVVDGRPAEPPARSLEDLLREVERLARHGDDGARGAAEETARRHPDASESVEAELDRRRARGAVSGRRLDDLYRAVLALGASQARALSRAGGQLWTVRRQAISHRIQELPP